MIAISVLVDKEKCYGCSACASVCPCSAIQMNADNEGFKYPHIIADRCIQCDLCVKVCPVIHNEFEKREFNQYIFATKHNDKNVLQTSTSGGFFTAISNVILNEGGVVYGAAFDNNMIVRHFRATNAADRDKMKGSKYVQSDLGNTFLSVKKDLQDGRKVLFTGTPCQVDGLIRSLQMKTDNLLCVDLICHGTPSPLVFADHLKLLEQKTNARIIGYHFRPKNWTWHVHREIAVLNNGKIYHSNAYSDLWRTIYYGRYVTKPSCHNCQYSSLNRPGDITMGDCRGIDRLCDNFGSDEGVSLVLVNSQKGLDYFNKIRNEMRIIEINNICEVMQPPLKEPSKQSSRRDKFWKTYHDKGYLEAVYSCMGKNYFLKYNIKKLLHIN